MQESDLRTLIEPCTNLVGGVLHACHRVMSEVGYISEESSALIADVFNISQAEIKGIISFYHDFKTTPQPPKSIKICRAESCQANGVRNLIKELENHLGDEIPCNTRNSLCSLDFTYCLGICPMGPAAMVDGQLVANVTAGELIEQL